MSWNYVVFLGVGVTLGAIGLGYGARRASLGSLRARLRWAIRLALGYAAVLAASVVVAGARFAWAAASASSTPEERALLLGACLASALNLVLGFLLFGMAPSLVAFMVARRVEKQEESGAQP